MIELFSNEDSLLRDFSRNSQIQENFQKIYKFRRYFRRFLISGDLSGVCSNFRRSPEFSGDVATLFWPLIFVSRLPNDAYSNVIIIFSVFFRFISFSSSTPSFRVGVLACEKLRPSALNSAEWGGQDATRHPLSPRTSGGPIARCPLVGTGYEGGGN